MITETIKKRTALVVAVAFAISAVPPAAWAGSNSQQTQGSKQSGTIPGGQSSQQAQASASQAKNLIAGKQTLMTMTASYDSTDFLKDLQGNENWRNAFNELYGAHVPKTGNASDDDKKIFDEIAGDSRFDRDKYFAALESAGALFSALKDNATTRGYYNDLTGTNLQATGSPSGADRGILFDTATAPNFNIDKYLKAVDKAGALYKHFRNNAGPRGKFNTLYNVGLGTTTPPSTAGAKALFDATSADNYDQATYLTMLDSADSLYGTLQTDSAKRTAFEKIFNTTVATSGSPSADALTKLFDVVGATGYVKTAFLTNLTAADSLYGTLQTSSADRAAFQNVYSLTINTTGSPAVALRNALFAVVSPAGYVKSSYLTALGKADSLLTELTKSANSQKLSDFNKIYTTAIKAAQALSDNERKVLFDIVGAAGYDRTTFLNSLSVINALYDALTADATLLSNFNFFFGTNIQAGQSLSSADRTVLAGITGDSKYSQSAFTAAVRAAKSLLDKLRTNALLTAYNNLYGTSLASTGVPSTADRVSLFNTVSGPVYVQAGYVAALPKADSLYSKFKSDSTKRAAYNRLFGTSLAATGIPSGADLEVLFGTVGDPGYAESGFLTNLPKADSLLTELKTAAKKLTAYNVLFGTSLAATGIPSGADRKSLFDTVGDTGYAESTFINAMLNAKELLDDIRASDTTRRKFNKLFNAQLASAGNPSKADRTILYGIVGTANYSKTVVVEGVKAAGSLLDALEENSSDRGDFNYLYGTNLTGSGPITVTDDRNALFAAVGVTGYDLVTYIPLLRLTASLLREIRNDSVLKTAIESLNGVTFAASGKESEENLKLLYAIAAGDPTADPPVVYDKAKLIVAVKDVYNLVVALRADAAAKTAIESLNGVTISASGKVDPTAQKVLYAIVAGDPTATPPVVYDKAKFIDAVKKVYDLVKALRTDAAAKTAIESLNGVTISASGKVDPTAQKVLYAIAAGDPTATPPVVYDKAKFIDLVKKVYDLVVAVRSDAALKTAIESLYGITVSASGKVDANTQKGLFGIVTGDPNAVPPVVYDKAKFIDGVKKVADLVTALRADAATKAAVESLYSITLESSGKVSAANLKVLFGIVAGDPNANPPAVYDQATFMTLVVFANQVYGKIKADAAIRTLFNYFFGTAQWAPLTQVEYKALFLAVSHKDPNSGQFDFSIDRFVRALPSVKSLWDYLRGSKQSKTLAVFNRIFGTAISASSAPTDPEDRQALFDAVSAYDPAKSIATNQADFVTLLTKVMAPFYDLLLSRKHTRDLATFNALFGTNLQAGRTLDPKERKILFDLTSHRNPKGKFDFNAKAFLQDMGEVAALFGALKANAAARADFNMLFGTSLTATDARPGAALSLMFGIAGGKGYKQSSFLKFLGMAANLYRALQADPVKLAAFNRKYHASIPASGPIQAVDPVTGALIAPPSTGVLFNIVSIPGYKQSIFLKYLK